MRTLVQDLFGHQAWADAELWRALQARPGALDDAAIRERMHHIHQVQRAFLAVLGNRPPAFWRREAGEFPSMSDLREWARSFHAEAAAFIGTLGAEALERPVTIPWFKDPPCSIAMGQALTQAAMHSHYHRAQNATRLRELGGEPPLTDLIVWYWKGRPAPDWDAS
jgi:uncharacterized damage-inducible protein DinB